MRILTFSLDPTRHALIGLWSPSQGTLAVAEEYLPVPFGDLEHPLDYSGAGGPDAGATRGLPASIRNLSISGPPRAITW